MSRLPHSRVPLRDPPERTKAACLVMAMPSPLLATTNGLRIAALDPAHEATDVSAAGEDEPVFGLTLLCRVVVFRPFGQQSLQARDIQEPARQRPRRRTLDLRSEILASPIERAKPTHTLPPAAALLPHLRRH